MDERSLYKLTDFFASYKLMRYKKGETLLRADDIPQGIYFLVNGYVRIYALSTEGEELTMLILKAYDFFPVRWAITEEPVHYAYEAMTSAQVKRAPKTEFVTFLKGNPDVLFQFSERIFSRLGILMERIENLVFGIANDKVSAILLICAKRFGKEEQGKITLDLPLTHRDIASLVGLTRETVSVEMERLIKKGIISDTNRVITIHSLERLEQEALPQTKEEKTV